jgi:hypothetical protein
MSPETFNDALIECVKAAGGSKEVGVALWGKSQGIDAAQRRLLACLNTERAEKLSLDEIVQVMRMARDRGCHVGMQYLAESLGYTITPIEPKDELAELERRFIGATEDLTQMLKRIEHLRRPGPRAVGA